MGLKDIFFRKKTKQTNAKIPDGYGDFRHSSQHLNGVSGTTFACMDRIATEFGLLNYAIYSVETGERIRKHWILDLLKHPNLEDGHFNYFYQSTIDYLNGGSYWLKGKDTAGKTRSIFRLDPRKVSVRRTPSGEKVFYYGSTIYHAEDLVIIPSRYDFSTLSGGRSIFDAAQDTFDTAQSVDSFTRTSFENGIVGKRLVIDTTKAYPQGLTEDQATALKNKFQSEYTGYENAGRPILKANALDFSELGGTLETDNQSAELAKTREFQEAEIAKTFGVPVDILRGKVSSAELENAFTLFAEFAVRPMATQFQEAINDLLDDENYYFEFDYNGITKVSLSTRTASIIDQLNNGLLTLAEARKLNGRGPIEADDTAFRPVNLMPWNQETKDAYMAKQKKEMQGIEDPASQDDQHFAGGDDKQ